MIIEETPNKSNSCLASFYVQPTVMYFSEEEDQISANDPLGFTSFLLPKHHIQ